MRYFVFVLVCFFPVVAVGDLRWMPFQTGPATDNVSSFQLAANTKNQVLLAWFQPDDQTIYASSYHFLEKNWNSNTLATLDHDSITLLSLYFNDQGEASLLWLDGIENTLSLAHLTAESVWSSPTHLSLTSPIKSIQTLFDDKGNLSVVWSAWNGLENMIQGAFFSKVAMNWTPISDLSPIGFTCCCPKMAMNAQGEGVVAWQTSSVHAKGSLQSFIQAVTFNQHTTRWSKPVYFGYDWANTQLANPAVSIDANNDIALFWDKVGPNKHEVRLQYARFLASKQQWTHISELELGTMYPQFGEKGRLIWTVKEGDPKGLYTAEFDITDGLFLNTYHLANLDQKISNIRMSHDPLGKWNLFWINGGSLQVTHHDKQWKAPITIDKKLKCEVYDFARDPFGNVLLAIVHKGKILYSIGDYLLPPEIFYGKRVEVRYPTRKGYYAYLNWNHTYSPNVIGYILRRNGKILAKLPPQTLQYADYHCPISGVQYTLTVMNVDNIESLPVQQNL